MAEAKIEDSASALLAMSEDSSSAVKMRPTRNVKRNRRIFNSSTQSESPRKQSRPAPLKVDVPLTAKEVAQNNGLRLRNLLKLPKAHKWVRYEWFYSSLDYPLLSGENDFQAVLKENFADLGTHLMRKSEWTKIRRLMGKPRRCSAAFFQEERDVLEQRRHKIRLIQQRKLTELTENDMKDLPDQIPLPLIIGTKVTALLRKPQDGLYAGTIDAVDTLNNTYRITFDRAGFGTHTIPDYEVLSNRLQETIPLSSFQQRTRPTPRYMSAVSPPHRVSQLQLDSDPLLSFAPLQSRLLGDQSGSIGGFPIKFLVQITKLSKSLAIKKEKIDELKSMNTKAEKFDTYLEPLSVEFQKRYAYNVLELEELNRRLEEQLSMVQVYSKELSRSQGIDVDSSQLIKDTCDSDAKALFERRTAELNYTVQSPQIAELITRLTAMLLQLKTVSETDINAHDLRSIQHSLEDLRSTTDSANGSCFRNNVEVHVNHIQSCLTQMGNLHAFSSSNGRLL